MPSLICSTWGALERFSSWVQGGLALQLGGALGGKGMGGDTHCEGCRGDVERMHHPAFSWSDGMKPHAWRCWNMITSSHVLEPAATTADAVAPGQLPEGGQLHNEAPYFAWKRLEEAMMGLEARSPAYPGNWARHCWPEAGWPPRRNPVPAAGCHCHHGYCRQLCLVRSRFRDLHHSQTADARRQHRQPVAPRRRQRTRGAG